MSRRQIIVGWVLYAAALLVSLAGWEDSGGLLFVAGMCAHWRFWRIAIPVWTVCAIIGWHWGSRKH